MHNSDDLSGPDGIRTHDLYRVVKQFGYQPNALAKLSYRPETSLASRNMNISAVSHWVGYMDPASYLLLHW